MTAINNLIDAVLTAHPEDGRMRGLAMEARAALENPGASQAAKAREFGWQLVEDYRDAEQAWSSAVHEKHSTPDIRAEYQKARDALNEFFDRAALASLPQEPASQEASINEAPSAPRTEPKYLRYAIERAAKLERSIGEKASTPDNPYGGLMWLDDAALLDEAAGFFQ